MLRHELSVVTWNTFQTADISSSQLLSVNHLGLSREIRSHRIQKWKRVAHGV